MIRRCDGGYRVSKDELISPIDVLDMKGLCEYLGISRSTLRRLIKDDLSFPKGVEIAKRKRIWLRRYVISWISIEHDDEMKKAREAWRKRMGLA